MRIGKETNDCLKPLLGCVVVLAFFSSSQLNADTTTTTTTTMMAPTTMSTTPPTACPAAPDNCMDDNVHMRIGIPLWAPSLNGDITIGQHQGHIHKDFSSFFDRVDFIAPLNIELRKSRFYFSANGFYMKTSQGFEPRGIFAAPGASGNLTLRQATGAIDLGYELVRQPCYSLTAYAGARMAYLKPDLTISSAGFSTSRSTTRFYGDPIIGLYGTYQFLNWLGIYVKGDVGGFGLLNDHLTWAVTPAVEFRPLQHMYVRAGWEWLGLDVVNRNNFNFDATLGGPMVELGWRF